MGLAGKNASFMRRSRPLTIRLLTLALFFSTLTSVASIQSSFATAVTGVPSAPKSVGLTAGARSIAVSWLAPTYDGGKTITGYQVEYAVAGTNSWNIASSEISSSARSYTINGLGGVTSYEVRIAARYQDGLGAYGYRWQPIYKVANPIRNGSGLIEYVTGFGLGVNDPAETYKNTTFSRIQYRMQATYDQKQNYVEADFDKTLGTLGSGSETFDSLAKLQVPTTPDTTWSPASSNEFEIQGNVSNLTVESNVTGVENGFGLSGRLEIWPWNYTTAQMGDLPARSTNLYDDSDTWDQGLYGSFQLHNLSSSNKHTIFAWNRHFSSLAADAEIGFGNYSGGHSDWTFCKNESGCGSRSDFQLEISINLPITTLIGSALTPTFGTPTFASGTWTIPITNYDAAFTWGYSASNGTATAGTANGSTINVTVTPTANTAAALTVTTSRTGFTGGTATTSSYFGGCSPGTTSVGGYTYFAFKNVGSCNWSTPVEVSSINYLVVAGGGGGASRHAGGGGAGGLINATGVAVNSSALTIVVGAGGAGGVAQSSGGANASSGSSSSISGGGISIVTADGGGGGSYNLATAASGGSGGGGGSSNGAGGAGTSGQGNSGSSGATNWNGSIGTFWVGGGGGGAGGTGATSISTKAGSGGAGLEISWIPSTIGSTLGVGATGTTGRSFAGGGGGGSDRDGIAGGTGGIGGGGAGSMWTATAEAGTANTGGGGGGSGISGVGNGSLKGGDGGSGVVVIRYANTLNITYNANGGTTPSGGSATTITGGTISTLATSTYTGYTFNGWFTAPSGGTQITTSAAHNQTANFTLYAQWSQALLAYESFNGAYTNLTGNSGTGSSGFSGNWALVNAKSHLGALATTPVRQTTVNDFKQVYPAGVGFSLASGNNQIGISGGSNQFRMAARPLSTPISMDSNQTRYLSFLSADAYNSNQLMAGLLTGLPTDASDTSKKSILFGYSDDAGADGQFAIDYGPANWAAGCPDDSTTTCSSNLNYSAKSTVSGGIKGQTTISGSNYAYLILAKITSVNSGNDTLQIKALPYGTAVPTTDSSITWDATYSTAITGSYTHLTVQLFGSGYPYMDEIRLGTTYEAVVNPVTTSVITLNGNFVGSTDVSQTVSNGVNTLIMYSTTRTGLTLSGWNTNADGTSGTSYAKDLVNVSADTTLYAVWVTATYTVTMLNGGGTGSSRTLTKTHDIALALPDSATANSYFTRTGFTVTGWATSSGGALVYNLGANYTNNSGATLYPVWTSSDVTVIFNSNGGTGSMSNQSIPSGTATALSQNSFTRTGYDFAGWNTASNGSGTNYSNQQSVTITSGMTLYAQWTANYVINVIQTSNGTILYDGTTASETNTVTSGANRTFTFAPSAGYEVESILVDGVSISTPGSPNLTNLQSAIIGGYSFTNITSNRTISATYSAISATNLLLNLDATRSSSLPAAIGTTTPTWTSISPGATVSATGSSGTQVATGSTTTPNAPKSVSINNNGSLSTAGTGASFNFGTTTGVSLGTTGQASAATVEMWINPKSLRGTANTPWNILFTKWFSTTARAGGAASSEFHYALKWDGTAVRQNLFTTSCSDKYGSKSFGSGADFGLNGWHLVGFTVDALGKLQFYVNGKTDGSPHAGCGITIKNTSIAFVGDLIQTAGFDGSVAKLRFYNTALSAAAMQSNYNADARLFAKSPVYTITYNYDSATSGNSVQSADYIFGGTTITLPTPSRTGYTFDGWFTQASGGSKVGDGDDSFTPNSSATLFAQWSYSAALNPAFGSPTATVDGFTVSITNYDASYTWASPTVSSGSVTVTSTTGSTRVLTVTGLSPGASATITQNTSKAAHANGTATVTGTALTGSALTPAFGTPTRTSDGFTVTITNYDAAYTWATPTVTSGSVAVTSTSGSNRVLTVTGLNPGASATITQATSRTGYANGTATVTGTASVTITSLSIGGVTAPVRGATPVTTVTASTGYTGTVTWAAGGTALVGNFAGGTVYTATITLTATAGYTFTGVTANSFTVAGATATNLINSGVITAVFPATSASITYSAGTGGSGTAPSSPSSVAIGGTFTTPFSLYTRPGYSFGGWSDGTNTYAANATYPASGTVTGNVVLTAQWTGVTYTVLFVYNGRTGGDSEASKEFTTGGSAMILPTPTRNGYTFGGWYSNVALTTLIGNAGANYEPVANLTLYAKWNAVNYTVTYNSTNVVGGSTINSTSGTVPTDSANYNIGQSVSIKSNSGSLARTGYSFAGWVTSADGTGTEVNSGQTIEMGSQSINLYPKWNANTYTITYNLNGGTGDLTSAPGSWTVGNSDVTLPTTGITRTGYTFGNGSGGYWSSSQGGAAVSNTYSNIGNITLYAIWTVKNIVYSFSKGDAAGLTIANFPSETSTATFGSTITLPNLAGTTVTINSNTHLFTGWSFNSTIYRSSDSFVLSETEPTFTAIWTRLYDVRYGFAGGIKAAGDVETDSGDAECVTSGLCAPNQIITLRGAPTRTGYQFAGWKVQDSATIKAAGSTETVTATSYLFYGQWTAIDYEFSFNSTGGSNVFVNETKNIGQLLTLPDPGFRTGYVFAGWSADGGVTKLAKGSTYVVGSSSQAFVAVWTPNVYTIIFDWQGATGSVTPNATYTVGTGNLALPTLENRVKDGYIFAGWGETTTATALVNYQPISNKVLYALWTDGNYSLTLNGNGATVASQVIAVPRGTSQALPTRTRANFKFVGWFDSPTGGNFIGGENFSYLVPASQTLFAHWIQDSFFGVDEATLETASTFTASNSTGVDSTITHNPSNSSARIQIQPGALTAGTVITVRYFKETSRQQSLIGADKSYFFSVLVSWLLGSGSTATVPDTAADKPILVTLTNPAIKAGAMVYRVIGGVVSELQRATVDGSITVELRTDPELVIAAIQPTAPRSVTAASTGSGSVDVSWQAPSSNGGSAIIEYTAVVATDPTKSCITVNLTCTITGLSNSTSYNFVVTATNGVGVSPTSTPVSAQTGTVYTVTFDSKGGSPVSPGSFFTGGSVSAPTAPSRAGYAFAGWSATDTGTAVTFPYSPGVTTNITLFARWDALSYTVTFDSKGGTPVSPGSFFTGGSVSAPTAPTRSGFTFAGWSATDNGPAVTFPYSPGVMTGITLYARWTAVTQGGGSSGGGGGSTAPSTPAPSVPSEPVVPVAPVKSNLTVTAPIVVVGAKDAKVLTVDVLFPVPGSNAKPPVIKIDAASEKFIADVKVVEGKLVLTPETGFSGKKTVTVTITENGADRIIQIPLTVLPETVSKPVLTPTASNRSVIRWVASPNATNYTVLLNEKRVCSTSAISCTVNRILGPDAVIEVVSNGGDRTVSARVDAEFRQNIPVAITRLVSATITKSTLTKVDTKALDKVVALIKTQGFGTVVISEITTTSKTKALAAARIESIKKYITSKVGDEVVEFEITPVKSRTYFNNISVKG